MDRTEVTNKARFLWYYNVLNEPVEKADLILCLGSHDTNVACRTAELFKEYVAPYILVSGGHGKVTQNCMYFSEAETFSNIMVDLGVPWGKIIREPDSSNIGENFRFSKAIIEDRLPYVKKICVVTKPSVERRVRAAFNKQMEGYTGFVTSPQLSYNWYVSNFYKEDEYFDEMVNLLVSDIFKYKDYYLKGYQTVVNVPKKILQIAEQLANAGYDKYL